MSETKEFYKGLLKSELTLQEREKFAIIMKDIMKGRKEKEWQLAKQDENRFKTSISSLNNNGYLQINYHKKYELANRLVSMDRLGKGVKGPGGRTETEYLKGVKNLKEVGELCNNSSINNFVSLYLGAPASIYDVKAWWQYPQEKMQASNPQKWHRDRDDFGFLKLFMYCTDVDINSGPHGYLPKTHREDNLKDLFKSPDSKYDCIINGSKHMFLSDDQLKQLGYEGCYQIWLGKKGTCFFEDTRGFHRAYIPTNKPRLIFSITWTIGPGFLS